MDRLFVHIGTQKTGSTSLQQVLGDNRDFFGEHGYYVHAPGDRTKSANLNRFAMTALRDEVRTRARQLDRFGRFNSSLAARFLARSKLRRRFGASGCPAAILSSEMFSYARSDVERRRFAFLFDGFKVTPIVIFRNNADWRASWHNQLSHGQWATDPRLDPSPLLQDWYFDKEAIRRFWSSFGTLVEIDYDAAQKRHGSIAPAFLEALGLSDPPPETAVWLNARK